MRHQFIGTLGRGVELQRMVRTVMLAERHSRVCAIDAAGAGVDQMRRTCVPARFEHIGEADQVALDIGVRIFEAVANTGLRREMNDTIERPIREAGIQRLTIGQIAMMETVAAAGARSHPIKDG